VGSGETKGGPQQRKRFCWPGVKKTCTNTWGQGGKCIGKVVSPERKRPGGNELGRAGQLTLVIEKKEGGLVGGKQLKGGGRGGGGTLKKGTGETIRQKEGTIKGHCGVRRGRWLKNLGRAGEITGCCRRRKMCNAPSLPGRGVGWGRGQKRQLSKQAKENVLGGRQRRVGTDSPDVDEGGKRITGGG